MALLFFPFFRTVGIEKDFAMWKKRLFITVESWLSGSDVGGDDSPPALSAPNTVEYCA